MTAQLDVLRAWRIVPALANIFSSSYPDIQYYATNHMVHVCQMSSFIRASLWSWSYTLANISMRIACEHRSEVMSTTVWVPRNQTVSTPAQTGTWCTSRDMGYLHPYQGDDHFRRVGVHGYVTLLDKDWDNLFKCRCEFQSNTKGSLVYDNCCNSVCFIMNREPSFFTKHVVEQSGREQSSQFLTGTTTAGELAETSATDFFSRQWG